MRSKIAKASELWKRVLKKEIKNPYLRSMFSRDGTRLEKACFMRERTALEQTCMCGIFISFKLPCKIISLGLRTTCKIYSYVAVCLHKLELRAKYTCVISSLLVA